MNKEDRKMNKEDRIYVMVYGSLKKDFHNHDLIKDSTFISETLTKDKYYMYSMGGFPAVTEERKSNKIQGEIYEIDLEHLSGIDCLEGNGSFYQRKEIKVDGFDIPVWMYFIMDKKTYMSIDNRYKINPVDGIQVW
jgi:gamma-glutamylaminecyclotransferase